MQRQQPHTMPTGISSCLALFVRVSQRDQWCQNYRAPASTERGESGQGNSFFPMTYCSSSVRKHTAALSSAALHPAKQEVCASQTPSIIHSPKDQSHLQASDSQLFSLRNVTDSRPLLAAVWTSPPRSSTATLCPLLWYLCICFSRPPHAVNWLPWVEGNMTSVWIWYDLSPTAAACSDRLKSPHHSFTRLRAKL